MITCCRWFWTRWDPSWVPWDSFGEFWFYLRELFSFLNLFGLTEAFKDGVSVELIEEDHLESVLRLFDKEEPNDFRYAIIEYFNNNLKVSIKPFPDFSNKQFFAIISLFSRFLHIT